MKTVFSDDIYLFLIRVLPRAPVCTARVGMWKFAAQGLEGGFQVADSDYSRWLYVVSVRHTVSISSCSAWLY